MDLNEDNESEVTIDFPLLFDKDGEPTDGFKLVGANSRQYQEVDRAWKIKTVKKTARRGRGIDAKQDSGAEELVDLTDQREFAICCACAVGIYGFTSGGVAAELNPETLKAIFAKRPTWRPRMVNAIENDALFIKA